MGVNKLPRALVVAKKGGLIAVCGLGNKTLGLGI
jgi:hypothetical protein